MPNWVKSIIMFDGSEEDIQKIRDYIHGKEGLFDFETLIPMPEELRVEDGSKADLAETCYQASVKGAYDINWIKAKHGLNDDEFVEMAEYGKQLEHNRIRYGHPTWYGWRIENWGTKWNACEAKWSENALIFETAWAAPFPVIEELERQFPRMSFTHLYADEDLGMNCGQGEASNGTVTWEHFPDGSQEANDFALSVWGTD